MSFYARSICGARQNQLKKPRSIQEKYVEKIEIQRKTAKNIIKEETIKNNKIPMMKLLLLKL